MLNLVFAALFCIFSYANEDHATVSIQRWQDKLVVSIHHDDGWHTYWKNPGDSGLPSTFKFSEAGKNLELKTYEWPTPKNYLEVGDILTIGYGGIQHFFFENKSGNLEAKIGMLICKDICIPGEALLKLNPGQQFSTNRSANPYSEGELKEAYSALPQTNSTPKDFEYYLTRNKDQNILTLHYSLKGVKNFKLTKELNLLTGFPHPPFGYKREQLFQDSNSIYGKMEIEWDGEYQEPVVPLPGSGNFSTPYELEFLYNPPTGGMVQKIKLQIKDFSIGTPALDDFYKKLKPFGIKGELGQNDSNSSLKELVTYFFLAFLGGLILNLMPCVLPVISLKLFGLIKHKEYTQKKLFAHNLSYASGILATLFALAATIVGLKATGEEVGWGFQLQSPTFILVMMIILFIFSLNLFGLFEFITPGGSKLGSVKTKDGFLGDFFSGILTTILSTPCSAPFLGTALTFAFTSSNLVIFVMFFAIGLGLASPFLITAIFPKTLHIFPKPGSWMEKLKYFLGLSLIITTIWLYDVFVSLVDFEKISWRLNLLFALWFFAFFFMKKIHKAKMFAMAFFIFPVALTFMAISNVEPRTESTVALPKESLWQSWSEEKMQSLKGQLVFVDFTAEWCLTCKVNKKFVFETQSFEEFAKKENIVLLRADWTKRDDNITQFLKKNGSIGVPAYFLQKVTGEILSLGETMSIGKIQDNLK